MSDEESTTNNEVSFIGKLIEYKEYYQDDTTPEEVSYVSFLIKSTAFRNLSEDEENFDENRTWKQVKIEEVNPSDVSDSETENPENPRGEEEEENQDPQNSNDQNMDLDDQIPPSNPEENTGHEVAQHTNQSNTFLTRCETGRIAEATWISPPPTNKEYKENQEAMKILRGEQESLQAPVPSTSMGARGPAVAAEMSNQDIKASIAPNDTQSSKSESDSDSNKDL